MALIVKLWKLSERSCLIKLIFRDLGELDMHAYNSRVVSKLGQWFLPEPSGSGFSRMSGLNHSDSAAHGKH